MDQERLERVWRRVMTPGATPETHREDATRTLEAFITAESREKRELNALSGRCTGAAKRLTAAAAAEKARRVRALQAEYYLWRGDSFSPTLPPEKKDGVLSALRRAHWSAKKAAASYAQAAEGEAGGLLSPLYRRCADREEALSEALRGLIAGVLR